MWLASIAIRDENGEIIGNAQWTPDMWRFAKDTLRHVALAGIGDKKRERLFRMCITLCVHRGVTQQELHLLPRAFHTANVGDIAGAPLEVLSSRGVPDILSARPCASPGKDPLPGPGKARFPDLYTPRDCGECPSCQARAAVPRQTCRCALCIIKRSDVR